MAAAKKAKAKTKYNPQRKREKVAGHKVVKGKKRGPMSQALKNKISKAKLKWYKSAEGVAFRKHLASLAKKKLIGRHAKGKGKGTHKGAYSAKKHTAKKRAAKGLRGHKRAKGLKGRKRTHRRARR